VCKKSKNFYTTKDTKRTKKNPAGVAFVFFVNFVVKFGSGSSGLCVVVKFSSSREIIANNTPEKRFQTFSGKFIF
jgi:hypothetical protein